MSPTRRQAISAAYLSHEGDLLTFVSRFRPKQQTLSITLDVGHGDVEVEVLLQQARETQTGEFICQGQITEGSHHLIQPRIPESAQVFARLHRRTAARLRAISPSLPGFKALSIDLSRGGMKLETEDRLDPGSLIQMTLDLDLPDQAPIPLTCRVVWCQATGRTYMVGLQFRDLEPWIPPLLEAFQSWLDGTGLKPKPYRKPAELEFPEPEQSGEEEPVPPAGSISHVSFAQQQVELLLAWTRGEMFRVIFTDVLVFRDDRGVEGAAFYDALDLEESQLMTQVLKVMPLSLNDKRQVFHYQFLNRRDKPILEVLCKQSAEYQLIESS